MIRRFIVVGLLCTSQMAIAQNKDSLTSTREDSIYVTSSLALPSRALGFVLYQARPSTLEKANGISPLNALYGAAPGLTMDGMPFPGSARFRPVLHSIVPITSTTVIWDGIPYSYADAMLFQLNGFNAGNVSVAGPGGVFGYGPFANTGGILIDTKHAMPNVDWSVQLNTYPVHYRSDGDNYAIVFPSNLSLSKGGRNTSVRFFYSQVYQPHQKVGDGNTKMFSNQGGLAFITRIKRLHFKSTILAQQHKSERKVDTYNLYTTKNLDITAKGNLSYQLHPFLRLSALGGYDLNTYQINSKTTRKRIFYHTSLDFNKSFKDFSIFGSAAIQRDSSSMVDNRYSSSPQHTFKTNSFLGTLGLSLKDFLWIRSSIQSYKLSISPQDRKIYASYFVSLDVLKATGRQDVGLSKLLVRANYNNAYNYAGLLAVTLRKAGYTTFLDNQTSFETGLDVDFSETGIAITYFQQRWNRKTENCADCAGYVLQAITLDGAEIKVNKEISFAKTGKISLTAGGSLTWQLEENNGFSYIRKNTNIFLSTAVNVKRFFGSLMVTKEDRYDLWDFNADVPVPLREISIGYHMPEIDSRYLKSARISFNGRNFITGEPNRYSMTAPYRLYAINLSLKFR